MGCMRVECVGGGECTGMGMEWMGGGECTGIDGVECEAVGKPGGGWPRSECWRTES